MSRKTRNLSKLKKLKDKETPVSHSQTKPELATCSVFQEQFGYKNIWKNKQAKPENKQNSIPPVKTMQHQDMMEKTIPDSHQIPQH